MNDAESRPAKMSREDLAYYIDINAETTLDVPFREAILDVYERLPPEVQYEALRRIRCWILADAARPLPINFISNPEPKGTEDIEVMMIVPVDFVEGKSPQYLRTAIAHEIAHIISGYNNSAIEPDEPGVNPERLADDLCESWGFGRAYRGYTSTEGER